MAKRNYTMVYRHETDILSVEFEADEQKIYSDFLRQYYHRHNVAFENECQPVYIMGGTENPEDPDDDSGEVLISTFPADDYEDWTEEDE